MAGARPRHPQREAADRGRDASSDVHRTLRQGLADAKSTSEIAAFAIGAGLARDEPSGGTCAARLAKSGGTDLRGALALAIGMVGADAHVDELRRNLAEATYRPVELSETAIALGLLHDRRAVDVLVTGLDEARSLAAQAAYATALGKVGDARAVAPLLQMLGDGARTDRARAFAAAALGAVADRDPLPWNTALKLGVNPSALPVTLYDSGGYGVLNLL